MSVLRVHEILKSRNLISELSINEQDIYSALAEMNSSKFKTDIEKTHINARFKENKGKKIEDWRGDKDLYYRSLSYTRLREIIQAFENKEF